jgi:hypothetical protein
MWRGRYLACTPAEHLRRGDIDSKVFEKRDETGKIALICRQGEPKYEIVEKEPK